MDLDDSLRARSTEYDAAIDHLLDSLHGPEEAFAILGIELIQATTAYARALNEASRAVPREIAEHYLQLAHNLHIEAPFLIAKLTGYRERHIPATPLSE